MGVNLKDYFPAKYFNRCFLFTFQVWNIKIGTHWLCEMDTSALYVLQQVFNKIKIFAITAANNKCEDVMPLQPLYDDFKNDKPMQLRTQEMEK